MVGLGIVIVILHLACFHDGDPGQVGFAFVDVDVDVDEIISDVGDDEDVGGDDDDDDRSNVAVE